MQEDNKKIMTVSFVALGLLVGFVTHLLLQFLAQNFSFITRIESNEIYANGIPVVFGAITFVCFQFNRKVVDFSDGVVSELRKVVWPTRKQTGQLTILVIVMLLISGVVVGVYDAFWAHIISLVMK